MERTVKNNVRISSLGAAGALPGNAQRSPQQARAPQTDAVYLRE